MEKINRDAPCKMTNERGGGQKQINNTLAEIGGKGGGGGKTFPFLANKFTTNQGRILS